MPSSNTFQKVDYVAMKGLDLLTNTLNVGPYFSTEYSGEYAQKFAIGRTLRVPLSQRYIPQRNNMTYNPAALDRPNTTITVDQTFTQSIEWESIEKALDMERGEERVNSLYIKPAISYIRQGIESYLCQYAAQNANMLTTGALGTNPSTYDATSANALQLLVQMSCPVDDDDLGLFVPPSVTRAVKTATSGYFNPQLDVAKQFRTGMIGKADSFDWSSSNSLYRHTAGTWQTASAVKINAASQSGSSITVACTTGDTFNQGDHFSIAAVNEVNLMTRVTTSTSSAGTKVFSITSSTTGASSVATLSIYPPIYGPGSNYQNVDALPALNAVLTLWPGTTSPNGKIGNLAVALYPGAFFLVGMKLEEPEAVEFCRQYTDPKTGISIRVIRQWDNIQSRMTTRMDTLLGCGIGLAEQCAVVIPCA